MDQRASDTTTVECACFYHVWVDGAWGQPALEHAETLRNSGFDGPLYLGLVGNPTWRMVARDVFPTATVAVEADSGFEQPTIAAVREYAKTHDGAVMYAHTKGAGENTEFRGEWRRSMNLRVVDNWRSNLDALGEYQAVGCHWLTPDQYPGTVVETPFFGGNYWIARCDYLRTLPECRTDDRFQAERWVGLNQPRALDLLPGWPHESLFAL